MPYGLPSMAAVYQRLMRGILEAQEDRRSAALAEMETAHEEPPVPPEPPEAPGLGAREDRLPQPTESAAPTPLRRRHLQVTSFKFHSQLGAPSQGCVTPRPRGFVPVACIPFHFFSR